MTSEQMTPAIGFLPLGSDARADSPQAPKNVNVEPAISRSAASPIEAPVAAPR
jgi:hypothetical protein